MFLMKITLAFLIILSLILISAPSAFAKSGVSEAITAIIIDLNGKVEVKGVKDKKWKAAQPRMPLAKDDSIKTGKDSWIEVGFGEELKGVVRVKEATTVRISELGPVALDLLKGEVRTLIDGLVEGSTFEIRAPNAVCGARGTGWDVATDGTELALDTYENTVFLQPMVDGKASGAETFIEEGKRATLTDPTMPVTINDIPLEKMEEWGEWKKLLPDKLGDLRKYLKLRYDSRYLEAKNSYEKAMMYMARGDKYFRKGFGKAKEMYEHAENYFLKTMDIYKKIEHADGVDLAKEIGDCENLYRETHVKVGQVKRKILRRQ